MRIVIFCHSLVSDWNHGNAHFLRGVCSELVARGHGVSVLEPRGGWSRTNLTKGRGEEPEREFARRFPQLASVEYELDSLDLDRALEGADLVIAHEWSEPELIRRLGVHRRSAGYRLLFHDTHHRAVSAPQEMARFDLSGFDGVLAFGEAIRQIYLERDWAQAVWTWHEAADTRVFAPLAAPPDSTREDLVWIGNWGDGERSQELRDYLFEPVHSLGLSGSIHGVRYPLRGRWQVRRAGLRYRGWLANHRAPEVFARHRVTVHVPRRPYAQALPGIPTIRVFEALACGIPLICAPWQDSEGLFRPGEDYLLVADPAEMAPALRSVLDDRERAAALVHSGLERIRERHTCAHRVDELLAIYDQLSAGSSGPAIPALAHTHASDPRSEVA